MDPTSPHRSSMLEKFHLFTVHVTSPNWVKPATTHDSCCFLPFLLLHCTTRIHTPQPTLSKIHNPSLFFPTNKHFSLLSLCSLPLFIYWETVVGRISYFLFAFPTPSQKSTLHASLGFHVHCCFLSLVSIHYFSCFLLSSLFFITKIKFNSAFLFFFFFFLLVFLFFFFFFFVFFFLFFYFLFCFSFFFLFASGGFLIFIHFCYSFCYSFLGGQSGGLWLLSSLWFGCFYDGWFHYHTITSSRVIISRVGKLWIFEIVLLDL